MELILINENKKTMLTVFNLEKDDLDQKSEQITPGSVRRMRAKLETSVFKISLYLASPQQ